MKGIQRFVTGHKSFSTHWVNNATELLRDLAKGQKPEALVVSCSDSRVIPELITNAEPGTMFVVRNVGNLIPPVETGHQSVGAALAYAINHLKVSHLIVLGHYKCGGMGAVRDLYGSEEDHHHELDPAITDWLKYAKDSWDEMIATHKAESADWHDELVEENVLQQLANTLGYPVVSRALDEGRLQLHAWIYDLSSASLRFWDSRQERFVSDPNSTGLITREQVEDQDDA